GAGPRAGSMVAGALANKDGVGKSIGDVGHRVGTVAIKETDALLAVIAGHAIVARALLRIPTGTVKAFNPAVAADIVAVCHGGDGGRRARAVVDIERILQRIRWALENLQ